MEASHKTHRPHIKVGKDEVEEEDALSAFYVVQLVNLIFLFHLPQGMFCETLYIDW